MPRRTANLSVKRLQAPANNFFTEFSGARKLVVLFWSASVKISLVALLHWIARHGRWTLMMAESTNNERTPLDFGGMVF